MEVRGEGEGINKLGTRSFIRTKMLAKSVFEFSVHLSVMLD